jgi:hypothetical protein
MLTRAQEMPAADGLAGGGAAARTFLVLVLAACGMACLVSLLPAAGHDQMWLLYAARLVRHGAKLYGPEVFETNPPMIFWLSSVPVALAEWLHASETAMGKLCVVLLECVVVWICLQLLRRTRSSGPGVAGHIPDQPPSPAVRNWLLFVFVAVLAVMPARDFGQRDHLLVLLCLPYVFAAALAVGDANARPLGALAGAAVGAAALAGIAMKPHQLLIPVAVETTLIVLRAGRLGARRAAGSLLRPEFVALVSSGVVFLLAVRLLTPNYFAQVVPLVRDAYWAFGQWPFTHLVTEAIQLHILAAIALGLFFAEGWRRASPLVCLLLAAGVASLAAYYLQGTGWYYQQLPSLTFFALALAFLLVEWADRRHMTMPLWAPKAAAGLGVVALGMTAYAAGFPFTDARSFPIDIPDASFFTGLPPGTAVTTLSTTVDYIMPPIYKYDLTLGERYPLLVMLPAILRSEDPEGGRLKRRLTPERVAELDAFQHTAMREDLVRWRPQLILVERCQDPAVHCQVLEDRHDDLLAWFLRDPGFHAQFAGYRYWKSVGQFDGYVRK